MKSCSPKASSAIILVLSSLTLGFGRDFLDQANSPAWTGGATNIMPANQVKQTFVPSVPFLTAVEVGLKTGKWGYRGDQVTLKILSSSGRELGSASTWVPEGFSGFWRFDLHGCVALPPGQPCTLQLAGSDHNVFFWKTKDGDPYPAGRALFGGSSFGTNDFLFRTYGASQCLNWKGNYSLGVYTLCEYEDAPNCTHAWCGWKPSVCVDSTLDPYHDFWDIMNSGIGQYVPGPFGQLLLVPPYADPYDSQRLLNDEVVPTNTIPAAANSQKSWDDFDLVIFYGHNNTIVPPHGSDYFAYYNYEYDPDQAQWVWNHKFDNVNGKWGSAVNYDYYVVRPIQKADRYPGAVTYLYNTFTSLLIGGGYDYGGGTLWRQHWDDPLEAVAYGKLGDRRLKWLILHGCQAVITANLDGSYNPLALKIFGAVHGKFHIVMGHYKTYYTNQLKPLASFAYDLLNMVPIQAAYFDSDPDNNSSAIAAESPPTWWDKIFGLDHWWSTSTMLNDRWGLAVHANEGTDTFSMMWIRPYGDVRAQWEER